MDAIEHLPGCDLHHKPRQRCSSWVPRLESVGEEPRPSTNPERPSSVWGYLLSAILPFSMIVATAAALILSLLIFAMIAGLLGHPVSFGS